VEAVLLEVLQQVVLLEQEILVVEEDLVDLELLQITLFTTEVLVAQELL
jgi:hypothetical protein